MQKSALNRRNLHKMLLQYNYEMGYCLSSRLGLNVGKGCTSVITAPAQEQALLGQTLFESRNDLLYLRQFGFHQFYSISLDETSMAVSGSSIAKTKARCGCPHISCFQQDMNWRVSATLGSGKLWFFKEPALTWLLSFSPMAIVPLAKEAGYCFSVKGREQ